MLNAPGPFLFPSLAREAQGDLEAFEALDRLHVLLACGERVYDNRRRVLHVSAGWSQCPAVESIPGKVSGAWVFRGTRMPVATVFENLEAGANIEEIVEWFDLTREQVTAVLDFAARSLEAPVRR